MALIFKAWQRSQLFSRVERAPGDPRLTGVVTLTMTDTTTGQSAPGNLRFTLMAPADVDGFQAGAVRHMAPAPNAADAETTKLVHLDFSEPDLPWRYTPEPPAGERLRPWLALLVGTPEELAVEGATIKAASAELLKLHPLAQSDLWAHVQDAGGVRISRLLSPRRLEPRREYLAVVTRAFNRAGGDMWDAAGVSTPGEPLRALHAWRFWTAEAGDFETLATALQLRPAGDVGKATLRYHREVAGLEGRPVFAVGGAITSLQPDLGRIDPATLSDEQVLDALTALRPLPGEVQPGDLTPDERRALLETLRAPVVAQIRAVRADLDTLNDALPPDELGREVIGMPHYGRPWLPDPDAAPAGWPAEINDDPRFRSVAGLGVWMGVEGQEALMDAAVQQAGALRDAILRVGHLALGLDAAGRLWGRRLPQTSAERLRILGPTMGRMLAEGGGTVLERVTTGASPLTPALFSGAARRRLRAGGAQARHVAGGLSYGGALAHANTVEPMPEKVPDGLPHADIVAGALGLRPPEEWWELDERWAAEVLAKLFELLARARSEYRHERDELLRQGAEVEVPRLRAEWARRLGEELAQVLQDLLAERALPCEGMMVFQRVAAAYPVELWELLEPALDDDAEWPRLREALLRELRRCMTRDRCRELTQHAEVQDRARLCDDLLDNLPPPPEPERRPISLDALASALDRALDPRLPSAPGRLRVTATIGGLDLRTLAPPEFPIGLDFPTWILLNRHDKEWLLPGAGQLPKDTIIALQTNPAFIDAYMVGVNSQFQAELRWRDLGATRNGTPLRMFWGPVDHATDRRRPDIQPLAEWARAPEVPLGDRSHQVGGVAASHLVILFRSDLFRRYPRTLVYLVRPPADAAEAQVDALLQTPPRLDAAEEANPNRAFWGPTFRGTLAPDLTFFLFDIAPEKLDSYWLVLDEPPAELRFRGDRATTPTDRRTSADYARATLDQPTRVAISGAELERQGLQA